MVLSSWVIQAFKGSFTACLGEIKARTVLQSTVCFLYVEKGSGKGKGEILLVTLIREVPITEQEPNYLWDKTGCAKATALYNH